MSTECVVAIDIGASSGRLIACMLDDTGIQSREIYRFENGFVQRGEHIVWDIEQLYTHICNGLSCGDGLSIKGVGVDMWGVDYVLVDEAGEVLDDAFAYRDARTDAVYEQVQADIGVAKIYEITGIQFMPINTLYQLKAHVEQRSDVFTRAAHFLMLPDYFHYRLSGVFSNEFTNATTTQLLNCTTKEFDATLLGYLGLSADLFPMMVQAGRPLGRMSARAQRETGLAGDVQIIAPGTHDTASAVAVHIGSSTTAYISSGTWSLMGCETDAPVVSEMARKYNFSNEGGVCGINTLLKNIMGMWILNCVRDEIASTQSFDDINQQAQQQAPFRTIIDPNASDFLNPASMTEAIRLYAKRTGQGGPDTIGEYARCIYESLALQYKKTLDELEAITGRAYTHINIIGGGSRNRFLNQLTADVTQRLVIAGPVETSSLGNASMQMIALGWVESLQSAREIISRSEELVHYRPKHAPPSAEISRFFHALPEVSSG